MDHTQVNGTASSIIRNFEIEFGCNAMLYEENGKCIIVHNRPTAPSDEHVRNFSERYVPAGIVIKSVKLSKLIRDLKDVEYDSTRLRSRAENLANRLDLTHGQLDAMSEAFERVSVKLAKYQGYLISGLLTLVFITAMGYYNRVRWRDAQEELERLDQCGCICGDRERMLDR